MPNRPPVPVSGDFPSNSMKSKMHTNTAPKDIAKKRSSVASVISEHSDEVKSYIIYDILAPAVKDMISSIVKSALGALQDAIETSLYGAPRKSSYGRSTYTDYTKRYKSGYPKTSEQASYNNPSIVKKGTRPVGNFNDIQPCRSRGDAEKVLGKLIESIATYGEASVGDYYDFMGISSEFTDRKWGWTDLSQAGTYRDKDGYRIDLPDPKPL